MLVMSSAFLRCLVFLMRKGVFCSSYVHLVGIVNFRGIGVVMVEVELRLEGSQCLQDALRLKGLSLGADFEKLAKLKTKKDRIGI